MRLNEIFDTDCGIGPEDWQENNRFLLADFAINNIKYVIQLERKEIFGIRNAAELSFFQQNLNDEEAFSTTHDQKAPTKVYGCVVNAIKQIISRFDAIYFEAIKRHSETKQEFKIKEGIYSTLATILKGTTYRLYQTTNSSTKDIKYLLSKVTPSDESKMFTTESLAVKRAQEIFKD